MRKAKDIQPEEQFTQNLSMNKTLSVGAWIETTILAVSLNFSPVAIAGENVSDTVIVDAIYIAEGGKKAKVPYGILSIKTNNPRQICLNTVRNHRKRHARHSPECKFDFITCLANRYCPPSADLQGNKNWIRNVTRLIERRNKK